MQNLDVISINIWHILISLLNLVIIFFIVKKLLFKPVRAMLAKRQSELDARYDAADEAQRLADEAHSEWQARLEGAKTEADSMISEASDTAKHRAEQIVADAERKAELIVENARTDAELEMKKARESIKREIVDVSAALAEKMLEREIDENDHRTLIDSFIGTVDTEGDNK